MKVCIKENEFNPSLIFNLGEEYAIRNGYNIYEIPNGFEDCAFEDFDTFGFNIEKYNARKKKEENQKKIPKIKTRLDELNKDFIQHYLGAVIPDIEDKKIEFINLHNTLRNLEGKLPRDYVGE